MKLRNIGRYQIKQELDHGGMSVVYLAHDPRFRRDVAIKVLSRNLQGQASIRARFEREARIIAALDHPAIVTVYDFGEDDGQPYLVMRFMPGGSLSDLLTFGRLNLADSARIAERIGGALDVAHAHGLVHRDLKPANILFDASGDAFLTDFGIVKLFEGDNSQINMTGSVVLGTPAYMSPEQALGKPIDKRSDVYSLGAVLYEVLTGVPPYMGPTSVSVAMKHVMDPVPHVREHRADIPDALDAITAKAMAKDANDRYATASELATAFADAVRALPKTTQTGSAPSAASRKPITEANQKLRRAADMGFGPEAGNNAATAGDTLTSGSSDTQMTRNRNTLKWLGIAAGVLAVVGIGLTLVASLISGTPSATPQTPTPIATEAVIIPPPQEITPNSEVVSTQPAGEPTVAIPTVTTAPSEKPKPIVTVLQGGGRVRSGPGTNYAVLDVLRERTQLQAIAVTRGLNDGLLWFQVILPGGQIGFVREDVVSRSNEAAFDVLPTAAAIPPTPLPTATTPPTITPSATPPPTPSNTPTRTATPTATLGTATPIPLPSATHTPTTAPPTVTAVASPTDTATPEPTMTAAPTATSAP